MSKFTYILDPGHGGINPATGEYVTPGKRAEFPDGTKLYEGVWNRSFVDELSKALFRLGIKHTFTAHPSDWKDMPLSTRTKIANDLHKKTKCIFISIHSDGVADESAHGFGVFTSPGSTDSDVYAKKWLDKMAKAFPTMKNRGHREKKYTVLVDTKCPSILIERAFHTNYKEAKLLMSKDGQTKMVNALVQTIQEIERC